MRKILIAALTLFTLLASPALAGGGLDVFLRNVNIEARADLGKFTAKVSAQFGVPEAQVRVVLSNVKEPADAFMVYQLGKMTNQSSDRVMEVYQSGKGRGWGAIAKDLGIKPGSPEFHALKRGDLHFGYDDGGYNNPGNGRGKGHGKGHGKGNR